MVRKARQHPPPLRVFAPVSTMKTVSVILFVAAVIWGTTEAIQSSSSSCSVAPGWDLPSSGGVINDGHKTITNSDEECCRKCNSRSDCDSWTRIQWDVGSNKKGECWMRNWAPQGKECNHCNSGVKETFGYVDNCRGNFDVLEQYDLPGGGLLSGNPHHASSDLSCCNSCFYDRDCKSWTYVKFDIPKGSKRGQCWLRNTVPSASYAGWATSGIRTTFFGP